MSSVDVAHGVDELSDAPTSHGESSGVRRRWLTGWCLVRGRVSVRTRIAAWSVLLLTASMLITVLVTHELLIRRADSAISGELHHEVREFQALGASPATRPQLIRRMREATSRVIRSSGTRKFGIVSGKVVAASSNVDAGDRHAVSHHFGTTGPSGGPQSGTLATSFGAARYVAVPVATRADRAAGLFVIAMPVDPALDEVWATTRLQLEVGALALLFGYVVAWLAAGRVLKPVRRTTRLARRITDRDLHERLPVRGSDEFNQLAEAFNAMLDRLRDTLESNKRLLADVGHELRTPITIVQGNLDTLALSAPEDRETLAIVFDELSRMTRLVNEALLLASSERPDFLKPRRTDLPVWGAGLAAKIQALSPREWTVSLSLSGTHVIDPERVTQAVVQLAANAITHTPPTAALELQLTSQVHGLTARVIDHGPGIPEDVRGRLFDRFAHGGSSAGGVGSGLGLAIVAAIAAAHDGSVGVSDTAQGGATFTLSLPFLHSPDDQLTKQR